MPPSRRSSSSRSSSSHRSSSHRSSSHSSSSHRSLSHSSSSHSSSSYRSSYAGSQRVRHNQPTGVPRHIRNKAICMTCRNHTYVYYNEPWADNTTGVNYKQGYYDEDGTYYDADKIAFKRQDGSYTARFVCEYCGTEAEFAWKEGVYPICSSCGAQMNKEHTYVDDVISVESFQNGLRQNNGLFKKILLGYIAVIFGTGILCTIFSVFSFLKYVPDNGGTVYKESYNSYGAKEITNVDIYGTDIYLDKIADNTYMICEQTDDYEKHLTWDYGADCYYDKDSDCYVWYNTDVSPNLWQYWYEDIAGSDYYGWMECEGTSWYIEVSDTEWEAYTGDTTQLWHIRNEFDSF